MWPSLGLNIGFLNSELGGLLSLVVDSQYTDNSWCAAGQGNIRIQLVRLAHKSKVWVSIIPQIKPLLRKGNYFSCSLDLLYWILVNSFIFQTKHVCLTSRIFKMLPSQGHLMTHSVISKSCRLLQNQIILSMETGRKELHIVNIVFNNWERDSSR